MKTKSLFLAGLVMLGSAVAFAGKDEPRKTGLAVIPVKGGEVYKLVYRGESIGKVKLSIFNSTGALVLTESIHGTDGFILPLNFTGLTSGEYTVEVLDASGKKAEKIIYQPSHSISSIHVSKLSAIESKFLVSISNKGSETIVLNIYDSENNLIHGEIRNISGDFAQVYKLQSLSSGFRFEITDLAGITKTIKF
jgi:hypothetical protein